MYLGIEDSEMDRASKGLGQHQVDQADQEWKRELDQEQGWRAENSQREGWKEAEK